MQCDEESEADTKDDKRNQEVAVGEDTSGGLKKCHPVSPFLE